MINLLEHPISSRVLIEGGLLHPRLDYNKISVNIPRLREPARFLHISDTHFGDLGRHSWLSRDKQMESVEKIVSLANDPDEYFHALLFTGDLGTRIRELSGFTSLFTTDRSTLEERMEPFKRIQIPMFASLGNHDTHSDAAEEVLRNVNFQMLLPDQNHAVIANLGNQLSIWALPDFETQNEWHEHIRYNIAASMAGLSPDIVPIIMTHNPDSFSGLPEDLFYCGVAGHTHGGVYQNEFWNSVALAKLGLKNKLLRSGLLHNGNGSVVHVSNGTGRHSATPLGDIPMGVTAIDLLPMDYLDSFHKTTSYL